MPKDSVSSTRSRIINPLSLLLIAGVIIFAISGGLWWRNVHNSAANVFWGMLDNSLSTTSVTKSMKEGSEQYSTEQNFRIMMGEQHVSYGLSRVSENTPQSTTTVVTETIGTPDRNFARYKDIDTTQKTASGEEADFSSVEGVWGWQDVVESGSSYFNESFLGIVPFAQLNPGQRAQLADIIRERNVYSTDFARAEKKREDGRPVYVYDVTINPSAYVGMMNSLIDIVGLQNAQQIDPAQYAQSADIQLQFTVDVRSRQLRKITYASDGREEVYRDYGVISQVEIPTDAIRIEELQQRLQEVQ